MILQSLVSSRKFDCQPRTMIDTPSRCGPIERNSGQSKLSQKHFDIQLCKNISYLRINLNGQSGQSQSLKIGYCRLTSCRFRNNGRIISLRKAISAYGISGFSIFKFQILSFKVFYWVRGRTIWVFFGSFLVVIGSSLVHWFTASAPPVREPVTRGPGGGPMRFRHFHPAPWQSSFHTAQV